MMAVSRVGRAGGFSWAGFLRRVVRAGEDFALLGAALDRDAISFPLVFVATFSPDGLLIAFQPCAPFVWLLYTAVAELGEALRLLGMALYQRAARRPQYIGQRIRADRLLLSGGNRKPGLHGGSFMRTPAITSPSCALVARCSARMSFSKKRAVLPMKKRLYARVDVCARLPLLR